jgi:4-hydroxy-tetrahydrodipicolinate synthase
MRGVFVALITPFLEDLSIDWKTFERLVDWLCDQGIDGVVPCGTTGEALALSPEEQREVIRSTVKTARKRVQVLAGTAGVTLPQTLSLMRAAQAEGAEGALVVTPYYIRPSQEGLFQYYSALHQATQFPMVLYNNPGRTCVTLEVSTIRRLAELPFVLGLKDSSSDLSRPINLMSHLTLFSGEDATFLPFLAAGGHGIISVSAGIIPGLYQRIWHAWQNKEMHEAQHLAQALSYFNAPFFQASNPGPIKYAYSLLGWGKPYLRVPLGPLPASCAQGIAQRLTELERVIH